MDISAIRPYLTPAVERTVARPAAAPTRSATQARPRAGVELPTDAPAGTESRLWSVLTADERAWFGRVGARQTVYGPSGQTSTLAPRGQSVDLRA